jgi:hypothetical protein
MPNPKHSKTPKKYDNPAFRGFININLTDDDRATIKASAFTAEDFDSYLMKHCDSGLKFTFSFDDYTRGFQVVATHSDKDHEDYGVFLSGRGSTPLKAFKQWCYLLNMIGESSWSENMKPTARYDLND